MKTYLRYFLDTAFICRQLKNKDISDAISFWHFFIIMGFDWLQFTLIGIYGGSGTVISKINSIATFLITIFGILYLYICNNGKNGTWFLQKFFALSVSVGWKFVVVSFVGSYILGVFIASNNIEIVQSAFILLLNILMFLFIGKAIKATL